MKLDDSELNDTPKGNPGVSEPSEREKASNDTADESADWFLATPEDVEEDDDQRVAGESSDADSEKEHEPTLGEIGAQAQERAEAERQEITRKPRKKVPLGLTIAIAVIVALVFGYGGFVASGPINSALHPSSSTISADSLNNVIASYVSDGKSHNVTANEVITGMGLTANSDGSYSAPGVSTITSYVQNKALSDAADARGITVSDDEVKASAQASFGSSDFDAIGKQYNASGEQVKAMIAQDAKTRKLMNDVVGFDTTMPDEPTDPGKAKRGNKTTAFATSIVDMLTKAGVWDASKGTWSNTDNDYYKAIGKDFDGKTASYTQAKKVYDLYAQEFQSKATQGMTDWQNFLANLYGGIQLTFYGVYSS